jgi:hypothetical protein
MRRRRRMTSKRVSVWELFSDLNVSFTNKRFAPGGMVAEGTAWVGSGHDSR